MHYSIKVRQDVFSTIIFHHKVKLNLIIVTILRIVCALYTKKSPGWLQANQINQNLNYMFMKRLFFAVRSGLFGEACSRIPAPGSIGWWQKTSDLLHREAAGSLDKIKDLVYGRNLPLCDQPLEADVFHPRICEVWEAHKAGSFGVCHNVREEPGGLLPGNVSNCTCCKTNIYDALQSG